MTAPSAETVVPLHRRSLFPASNTSHMGRYYCVACTVSVDDFTAYMDWPCPTALRVRDGLPVAAPIDGDERP
jgi:hypothetical protein